MRFSKNDDSNWEKIADFEIKRRGSLLIKKKYWIKFWGEKLKIEINFIRAMEITNSLKVRLELLLEKWIWGKKFPRGKIENYGSDKGIQKKLRPEVSFFQEWPEILINTYY